MTHKSEWDGRIPFNPRGDMLPYVDSGNIYDSNTGCRVVWEGPYIFSATLTFVGFDKRSPHRTIWEDSDKHTYSMNTSEFATAIQKIGMQGDKIRAGWAFRKRGSNYSICIDDEQPPRWCTACDSGMNAAVQLKSKKGVLIQLYAQYTIPKGGKAVWFCVEGGCITDVTEEELPEWRQGTEPPKKWSDEVFAEE